MTLIDHFHTDLTTDLTTTTTTTTTTAAVNAPGTPTQLCEQEHPMSIDTDRQIDRAGAALLEPREPDSPRPPGEAADAATPRTPVARCADGHGTLSALFFSDNVIDIARAKAMCGLCPLQADCLSGALEREEPWGVWGGQLLSGGRIIANKRPCGRPPKHPRPEMVIDELGPVGTPVAVA